MKIELQEPTANLVKDFIKQTGLPDTDNIRQYVGNIAVTLGLTGIGLHVGTMLQIKEVTGVDICTPPKSREQQEPSTVDGVCPDCKIKPVKLGTGKIVCNCRVWND